MLKKTLFQIARSQVSGYFIGFAFARLSFLMPFRKVINSPDLVAFHHPVKFWEHHLLIVPKKAIPSLAAFTIANNPPHQNILLSIVQAAKHAVKMEGLSDYALVVNGGTYQDVPQIHFHLASGNDRQGINLSQRVLSHMPQDKNLIVESSDVIAYRLPGSNASLHIVLVGKRIPKSISEVDFELPESRETLIHIFELAQKLIEQFRPTGYSLLTHGGYDQEAFAFQIVGTTT